MATAVVSLLNVFDESDSEPEPPSVSPSPPPRRPLLTRPPQVSVKHEVVSANLEVVSQDCFAQRLEGISSSCMNCQKERAMTRHPHQGRHKRRRKQVKVNTPIVIKLKDTLKAAIHQKLQANYTNSESKGKYPAHMVPTDANSDDYPDPGWVKKNKNLTALLSVIEKNHKKNYYNFDSNLSYDSLGINLQKDHNHLLNNVKHKALSNSFKSKSKQKNIGECDNVDVICNDLTNLSERDTDSPITDSDSVVSSSDTLSDSETSVGTESSSTFEFSSEELDQLAEWTSGLPLICYDCPPSECPQCLSAWYTSQYYLYDLNAPLIPNQNEEFQHETTYVDSVGTDSAGDIESECDYVSETRNQSRLIIKDGETQTDESDWPYTSQYSYSSSNTCGSKSSGSGNKPPKHQKQLLEISVQAGKRIQDQPCLNTVYIDLSDTDVTFSVVYHHNLPASTVITTTTANTVPIVTLTSGTPSPTLTMTTAANYQHHAPTPPLLRNVPHGNRYTPSPRAVASVHGAPLVSLHPTATNPIGSISSHHKDVFGDMAPYVHSSPLFPFYCYLPPSITYPVAVPGFNAPFTVPKFDSSIPKYLMVPPNELRNFTASTPPQRHWIPLAHPERNRPTAIFTVMCYNVLCDKYCTRQLYGYCPSWALNWEYRKKGIMDEIKQYSADIISLQEVETDQFYNFFLPELKRDGYDGIFSPKSRARTMTEQERKHVDGCAIFFRTNKFALKKKHLIEFNQLAMANAEGSDEMLNRVMTKDNIGLAALLETKEGAYDNGNGMTPESSIRQPLLVATAHIHWDPEYSDVKLIQTMMLMWEFKIIMEDAQKTLQASSSASTPSVSADPTDCNAIPLILCGDLNSLPDSGVVEYISSGKVSPSHCDFKDLDYETCLTKMSVTDPKDGLAHNFRLTRAYSDGIIPYTNYTYDFKGIIDYIFFSEGRMNCLGVLGPLDEEWFKQNKVIGCPHPHISSDHFSLFVELEMPVPFTNGRPAIAASHNKIR